MLNWIKFIAIFLLSLTTVILVIVFVNAQSPISKAKDEAIEAALRSGQLAVVDSAELYNGTKSFVTVYGKDEEGNRKAVFVESPSDETFKEVSLEKGITASQAVHAVKEELKVKKILYVRLGIEEPGPIWEVTFKSPNGKLNYVYVDFENGEWWKRILNL